jgi:hypothetical protein
MRLDKKVSGGEVRFVLAKKIGNVIWGHRVAEEWIHLALNFISQKPKGKGFAVPQITGRFVIKADGTAEPF